MSEVKKIESLTDEQRAQFPVYVKKWTDIGLNTDRLNPVETKRIIDGFRRIIEMKDAPTIIVKNPIEAWVCCCLTEQGVSVDNVLDEMNLVFKGNPKKYEIPRATLPYQTGSFYAHAFSFYDYLITELKVPVEKQILEKYKIWEETSKLGCIYPLENVTFVSEKPVKISFNDQNQVHCDGGPAIEYDGLGDLRIYMLNGVVVPDWLATTNEGQLTMEQYNSITNADVRAEFVRKAGIEFFISKGTLLDTYKNYDGEEYEWWHKSEYQLYDMKSVFPSLPKAPFLKMLNQTTGIWHMEGVSPECKTIKDALKERFGGKDFIIKHIS